VLVRWLLQLRFLISLIGNQANIKAVMSLIFYHPGRQKLIRLDIYSSIQTRIHPTSQASRHPRSSEVRWQSTCKTGNWIESRDGALVALIRSTGTDFKCGISSYLLHHCNTSIWRYVQTVLCSAELSSIAPVQHRYLAVCADSSMLYGTQLSCTSATLVN
jgi:hypothetical protein